MEERDGGSVYAPRMDDGPRIDEQSSFEARAVLAPRRARQSRLALLLPLVALIAVAWIGVSGTHQGPTTTAPPDPAAIAARSPAVPSATAAAPTPGLPTVRPATVFGLPVHRLDDVQTKGLGPDDPVALTGWYVATAITDCPALPAIDRPGSLPDVRGDADTRVFCRRAGVLYASPPDVQDSWSRSGGLGAVGASIVVGVIVPLELETIGADATQVVVIGRFVDRGDACGVAGGCGLELLIDHVAWALGA